MEEDTKILTEEQEDFRVLHDYASIFNALKLIIAAVVLLLFGIACLINKLVC